MKRQTGETVRCRRSFFTKADGICVTIYFVILETECLTKSLIRGIRPDIQCEMKGY